MHATILLAPAHPGGPGKRATKRLWYYYFQNSLTDPAIFLVSPRLVRGPQLNKLYYI